MDEQNKNIRPTKKQRELLSFIEQFIGEHGYSPSYREIMTGCNYTSVATVSLHVNNLIKRGHLVKREHNARSIEVVKNDLQDEAVGMEPVKVEEKWFVDKITQFFHEAEQETVQDENLIDNMQALIATLHIFGMKNEAEQFSSRLTNMQAQPVMEAEIA